MQFTTFITAALVAVAGVSAASIQGESQTQNLQKRYDLRQLYSFKGGDVDAACRTWKCNCINYVPKDSSLHFVGAICEPGDYHGQHMDSQLKAACVFGTGQEHAAPRSINMHDAAASGFTLIQQE